ncbi:MAG TPA: DUF58 domain-containing protein [Actinomycetales bacterium]|nr:DUF58 domain-containing protein [Actinomycetales bacterium]
MAPASTSGAGLPAALSGLTTRGRAFLAAGAAAAACAVILGQRDLLRVAVLLVALPLASVLVVARARHRIQLSRTVTPTRVQAGRQASVRLELANLSRLPTGVLLAEDHVPYVLGARPRFVVDRLAGGARAAVGYTLRSEHRGRWEVGPLQLRITDPFGMCEVARSFTATDPLVVVPRVHPLLPLLAQGSWMGSGDSTARTAAASGEHDLATREYRHGDDLRRVHWRSTARRGELMVRRDEQPHQMRATVLLDKRTVGHRGDGPASSFEWAVSAAASACALLVEAGYGVRILSDEVDTTWTGREHATGSGELLDQLAMVDTGGPNELRDATAQLMRAGGDGLVIALLGEITPADAHLLATLPRRGVTGVAIMLDTTTWAALPRRRAAEITGHREQAARTLDHGGWTVVTTTARESISAAWARMVSRAAVLSGGAKAASR